MGRSVLSLGNMTPCSVPSVVSVLNHSRLANSPIRSSLHQRISLRHLLAEIVGCIATLTTATNVVDGKNT